MHSTVDNIHTSTEILILYIFIEIKAWFPSSFFPVYRDPRPCNSIFSFISQHSFLQWMRRSDTYHVIVRRIFWLIIMNIEILTALLCYAEQQRGGEAASDKRRPSRNVVLSDAENVSLTIIIIVINVVSHLPYRIALRPTTLCSLFLSFSLSIFLSISSQ